MSDTDLSGRGRDGGGALPNLIIIGAMKCGTSALHSYLARHPDIAMSQPKELNFFFGSISLEDPEEKAGWSLTGNWHRGIVWYRRHFPPEAPVRGEASPGYTSPDHPGSAERMAGVIPDAKLVYLVRDPIDRAVSQYRHHRRDGSETRPLAAALLDPASQYIARSRYAERLDPFLRHFARSQIAIVAVEDLQVAPRRTLRRLCAYLSVDDGGMIDGDEGAYRRPPPPTRPPVDADLRAAFAEAVADDVARLRSIAADDFARWSL